MVKQQLMNLFVPHNILRYLQQEDYGETAAYEPVCAT
jgi:hypothetical protein